MPAASYRIFLSFREPGSPPYHNRAASAERDYHEMSLFSPNSKRSRQVREIATLKAKPFDESDKFLKTAYLHAKRLDSHFAFTCKCAAQFLASLAVVAGAVVALVSTSTPAEKYTACFAALAAGAANALFALAGFLLVGEDAMKDEVMLSILGGTCYTLYALLALGAHV